MATRLSAHRRAFATAGLVTAAALTLGGCGSDSSSSGGNSSSSSAGGSSSTSQPATSSSSSSSAGGDSSSSSGSSSSASGKNGSYTMAQVKTHNTPKSCWAVIDKNVYNLTSWIAKHPGGPDKIKPLCGTDATQKFRAKHDSEKEPNARLASFKIGTLSN